MNIKERNHSLDWKNVYIEKIVEYLQYLVGSINHKSIN